ncbi:DUF2809 domain-containing protein [Winogradskyella maritima]|uniref:DUF2809 domain-containing protein n=1 Tax=Winogradskyella maritima TaxID=1517766 RepID=A0ABV8AH36_9FLAO|nr:DUF2809 domain-containing protein [Winogradskyella maritima]
MKIKFKFNKLYFLLALFFLLVEVLIAVYLKSGFVRHTFGDYLVVFLVYCFIKAFVDISSLKASLFVLAFAFAVEFLQLLNILEHLGLEKHSILKLVFGTTFQVTDLIAYTLGVISILILEHLRA